MMMGWLTRELSEPSRQDWSKEGIDFLAPRRDENNAAPQYQGLPT
jgi:hypothetical protein